MNIEEVLDDVARHLDFVYATGQFSIKDNEMREMLTEISILRMENKKLHSIIKEVREYIENNKIYTNEKQEAYTLKNTWYGIELLEILDKGE